MITREMIEAQRLLFSKPILIGEKIAVKVLTVRNKHFGILDGVTVPDRIMVEIDPMYVFGDGTHTTTQMVAEAIEKHIKPAARVLDVGCGTGIQSIISVLMGADHVECVDIDATAVKTAEHNATLNGVSKRIAARVANLTEGANGAYDLVIANILADPVIELLGKLPEFANDGTTVIVSGVAENRDADVTRAICKSFTIAEKEVRDGWICYVLVPGSSENELEATEADYHEALREMGVEV